ncbi:MAG: energy transducer TonB [Pseudomonadales bacterium]
MLTVQKLGGDRLGFALFLAVVVHAMFILGISFSTELSRVPERVLDVTIALTPSQTRPETVDFLSDVHQASDEEKDVPLKSRSIKESAPSVQALRSLEMTPPEASLTPVDSSPSSAARKMQSLQTDLSQFRKAQQQPTTDVLFSGPRVQRLSRANAAASPEAFYLRSWQRKVETIGNLNYPEAARRAGIYGKLRLLVAIRADGSLQEILILESSGESLLDQAAINIVSLAEPFPPFSEALRQTTDVLEIVRTWQFRKNTSTVDFTP